ncbi:hypothetical protein F5Y16DRAFT_386534 [Xylariaceae sp. FL0255]|nr:hypothetical protein F5Y16DRAFT_386534 [Xylariaceae sp. FL0255]
MQQIRHVFIHKRLSLLTLHRREKHRRSQPEISPNASLPRIPLWTEIRQSAGSLDLFSISKKEVYQRALCGIKEFAHNRFCGRQDLLLHLLLSLLFMSFRSNVLVPYILADLFLTDLVSFFICSIMLSLMAIEIL